MQTLTISQTVSRGSIAPECIPVSAVSAFGEFENSGNVRLYRASIDENAWIPHVVAITHAGSTRGVVCAKERKIAGMATGLIYADATLGAMVVAKPGHRELVFELAIRQLVNRRGFRGLRILVPPGGYEDRAIERILASRPLDVRRIRVENHSVLDLPLS